MPPATFCVFNLSQKCPTFASDENLHNNCHFFVLKPGMVTHLFCVIRKYIAELKKLSFASS